MTFTVKEQRSTINANAGNKGLARQALERNTVGAGRQIGDRISRSMRRVWQGSEVCCA
jgi:hypothetical protein